MKKPVELVVHFNKEGYWKALVVAPIMIAAMTALLIIYSQVNIVFPGWPLVTASIFYIILAVKIFFYIGIAFLLFMFLVGVLYAPFFLGYKGPAAVLDQNGIWIKHYGFIPWEKIEKFAPYSLIKAQKMIGIQVKDVASLSKQSSWDGKIRISWAKLFGTPHIALANLDTENEDIIIFAHRHLKN